MLSGRPIAPAGGMKEPSEKRQRTLALHDRAIRFSTGVNVCCPRQFSNIPSEQVWRQLVRAADSTSNNLIEADDALTNADFLNKMGIALREAKESRAALMKIRLASLDHFRLVAERELESEAWQLAAIYSAIIRNMRFRLDEEARQGKRKRRN
jgi:four helix bundle protein